MQKPTVGGGFKKVLYTLNTVRRIGLKDSAKALNAKNTCKACGLGMGGQHGGMTNELDEFPSVCNKSIQAQSTDIQRPIPLEVFQHSIDDFKALSAYELEHLGRLNTPLLKEADSDHFKPISWSEALSQAATQLQEAKPEQTFFYSSGRSSNEAAFALQLFARSYGSPNINNCSYYCHQATGVGLNNTIGTGTATIELADLRHADCIFVIGANPASNHPRFIHQLKNCRERGGQVIIINPAKEPGLVKFAVPKSPKSLIIGGHDIASHYCQNNIGSDWHLLSGIAKSILEQGQEDHTFIQAYCEAFNGLKETLEQLSWPSIEHATGIAQSEIEHMAHCYSQSNHCVFAWGMGITHHQHGVHNVEAISNLALLRGMIGKPGAGLLPLRGHSNVQGIGSMGVKPDLAPAVLNAMQNCFDIKSLNKSQGLDTLACLQEAHQGNIDAAVIMGGNLYAASPDSSFTQSALNRIKHKIFLTTTLNSGHLHGLEGSNALILPVTARDEEPQATTQESMFNYVRMSDGGIDRIDNLKSESEIVLSLCKQVLPEGHLNQSKLVSHDAIRQGISEVVTGFEQLAEISTSEKEFHIEGRIKHTPIFNTASGKARFIHTLPTPTKLSSQTPDALNATSDAPYPFMLMSMRSEGQFNSIIYEENDSYRSIPERWAVLLSPEDILALHQQQGLQAPNIQKGTRCASACIRSKHGEMQKVSVYPFNIKPGNIAAYYPEANCLIGQEVDPRSQTPAFKSVPVSITLQPS